MNETETLQTKKTGCETGNSTTSGCCGSSCDGTMAFLLLRGWLGIRALMTGIEKFGAYKTVQKPFIDPTTGQPDPNLVTDAKVKFYSLANYSGIPSGLKSKFTGEPFLPSFAMGLFDRMLGPFLIISGLMLLLGVGTRLSLFLQGLVYIALTIGLILIGQNDGVAWLGIHLALIAFALVLAKNNKLALLKKW